MGVDDILEIVEKLVKEHIVTNREQLAIMEKYDALKTTDPEIDGVLEDAERMKAYKGFLEQLDRAVLRVDRLKVVQYLQAKEQIPLDPDLATHLQRFKDSVRQLPASCHPPDAYWEKVARTLAKDQKAYGELLEGFLKFGKRMQTLNDKINVKVTKYGNHPVLADRVKEAKSTILRLAEEEIRTRNILISRIEAGRVGESALAKLREVEEMADRLDAEELS